MLSYGSYREASMIDRGIYLIPPRDFENRQEYECRRMHCIMHGNSTVYQVIERSLDKSLGETIAIHQEKRNISGERY